MSGRYIVGLDQSTSGTKVVLVDECGEIQYKKDKSHKQYYPHSGWVEHDPTEIFNNCVALLRDAQNQGQVDFNKVVGLSITNQRETVVFWDKGTQEPLCNAFVWQCRRGIDICLEMHAKGFSEMIEEKTGLKLDTYFSASKIKWAMTHQEAVKDSALSGNLMIGTIDSWLIYKLTNGREHVTDHTNASRTMLYNIVTCDWDDTLLSLFGIDRAMLPEIKSCNAVFGITDSDIVKMKLPICGVVGDSQGALFGQQCFEAGMAKATYGTGSSVLLFIGSEPIRSSKGILTSVAWCIDGKVEYALEGIINSSGDTLRWLKDNLGLFEKDDDIEGIIGSIDSCEGVYLIPAFVGLGAPYWRPSSKASIVGINRSTHKAHIIRAAVESMAYQVGDLLELMIVESGSPLMELNVDGGPTQNGFLVQFQSDLLHTTIRCPSYQELSVMGAVYLGGIGLGVWKDREALKSIKKSSKIYTPQIDKANADSLIGLWQKTVWYHSLENMNSI